MSRVFLTSINLSKNELQNAAVQNLASAPAAPVKGQLYFDTVGNVLYWWDGTAWIAAKDSGAVAFGPVVGETTFGGVAADGVAVTAARSDHKHANPLHDAAAHTGIPINSLGGATGPIDMNGFKITEVGTPTAPTDAANKQYVDDLIAGLSWKDAVRVASPALTQFTTNGLFAIDGVTLVAGDRVLLKSQLTQPHENGIWVAATGAWARATDADTGAELESAAVFVSEGATNSDSTWVMTTNAPITVGTTAMTWVQFSGGGLADNEVTNAKLADMPAATVKGRMLGTGTGDPVDLTSGQLAEILGNKFMRSVSTNVAAALSTLIYHGFNNRAVLVQVFRATTPWDTIECDVERTSVNEVTVRFATAPAAGEYTVVVSG